MKATHVIFIVIFGIVGAVLIWLIFSPQPGKDSALEPGTAIGSGWIAYSSPTLGFEVQYPPAFIVDETNEIPGVAFYIPNSMADRTNLSADTHVAVEKLPGDECSSSIFLTDSAGEREEEESVTIGENVFSYGFTRGAAAGNIYDEYVYAMPSAAGDSCFGMRLFLHYSRIENYEPGAVVEFDRDALIALFRDMAATLVVR